MVTGGLLAEGQTTAMRRPVMGPACRACPLVYQPGFAVFDPANEALLVIPFSLDNAIVAMGGRPVNIDSCTPFRAQFTEGVL